jgi:hypothetical protein
MAIVDTFGKCKCGEFNSLKAVTCHGCGSRLPWAQAPIGAKSATAGAGAASGARTRTAQANYWSNALSGQAAAAVGGTSYNNDPDIDFTPFGASAGAAAGASRGAAGLGGAAFYCSYCGTGLKAGQHVCHSCRHMTMFTKADLRFTVMICTLLVSGFLLGVTWTAVVLNAANTGEWRLPGVHYTKSQPAVVKKPAPPIYQPKPVPTDEYGVPRR